MANETLINMEALQEAIIETLSSSMGPLITIFKVVGIALLIYIIFLLIKALFRWNTMHKISKISKNVSQINEKLDILITKLGKPKSKENKETTSRKKKKK